MNYRKIYDMLIDTRRNLKRSKKDGFFHRHHIIPKSLGGSDKKWNIVLLTPKEHFIAHRLLVRCFDNNSTSKYKMMCALKRFISFDMNISPNQFEIIQKQHALAASTLLKGRVFSEEHRHKISTSLRRRFAIHPSHFTGKSHTENARKLISEKQKGCLNHGFGKPRPTAVREKISRAMRGVKKSESHVSKFRMRKQTEDTRRKISAAITEWHALRKMDRAVY